MIVELWSLIVHETDCQDGAGLRLRVCQNQREPRQVHHKEEWERGVDEQRSALLELDIFC